MDLAKAIGQIKTADTVILKAGTIVKVGGLPFRLMADTHVEGHHPNLQQAALGPGVLQGGFGIAG